MAEQIHYRPAEARQRRSETEREFERLEGRLAEINGLLDELYASGIIRWLKDFSGALPQVSTILAEGMNTPSGQAGMRNLFTLAQQLGKIDPDRLERTLAAVEAGVDGSRDAHGQAGDYHPPGLIGVYKMLHDKQLWSTLAPAIAGLKAFAEATQQHQDDDKAPAADREGPMPAPGSDGSRRGEG